MDRVNPTFLVDDTLLAIPTATPAELPSRSERLPFTVRAVTDDRDRGVLMLLAESRLDHELVGTMRVQTNTHGPLPLEASVVLPARLSASRLAEATQVTVHDALMGRAVKVALLKALLADCRSTGIEAILIATREPFDRDYRAMLFEDVHGAHDLFPMAHLGNPPHRLLIRRMAAGQQRWAELQPALADAGAAPRPA